MFNDIAFLQNIPETNGIDGDSYRGIPRHNALSVSRATLCRNERFACRALYSNSSELSGISEGESPHFGYATAGQVTVRKKKVVLQAAAGSLLIKFRLLPFISCSSAGNRSIWSRAAQSLSDH